MPSKRGGGRSASQDIPAITANLDTAPRVDTASSPPVFDVGELGRSLRRGPEVDRFNELAGRQDALTIEESDELYRYRLRRLLTRIHRLERTAATADEGAIEEHLADFRGRREELRWFEEIRRSVGLPTGYEIDASAEQRALDRLLELASLRPHGLIAGRDDAPVQSGGSIRLREEPFAPSTDDVPIYLLVPPSLPSDALIRNVDAVAGQGARIRCVRELAEIPHADAPPLVLNWGSIQPLPSEGVILNRPDAVRVAADQVQSLERLRELAPRAVVNPQDVRLLGTDLVVAKRRHGSRGSGKVVVDAGGPPTDFVGYDCYQEFIPARREYRVSLLSDRVVSAYLKQPAEGATAETLRPDWTFQRCQVLPRAVVTAAREAARRIGLDYAGVDIIEDQRTGRVYCLEANAAPGMSEDTIRSLYAHVQTTVRGQAAGVG